VGSKERAERLLAEGRPYDAMMDAGKDFDIGMRAYLALGGGVIRTRMADLERAGNGTPEGYRSLAEEAVRGDEMGLRIDLVHELWTKSGGDPNAGLAAGGDFHVGRYRETGRMRYFETAMKYYGKAGARERSVALAREAVERFRREGGAVFLSDALEGLQKEAKLSEQEIAREVPELQSWVPVDRLLQAKGPFSVDHVWRVEETAAYDAFLQKITGRTLDSFFKDVREKAPRGLFGRPKLPLFAKDTLRTWGTSVLRKAIQDRYGKSA